MAASAKKLMCMATRIAPISLDELSFYYPSSSRVGGSQSASSTFASPLVVWVPYQTRRSRLLCRPITRRGVTTNGSRARPRPTLSSDANCDHGLWGRNCPCGLPHRLAVLPIRVTSRADLASSTACRRRIRLGLTSGPITLSRMSLFSRKLNIAGCSIDDGWPRLAMLFLSGFAAMPVPLVNLLESKCHDGFLPHVSIDQAAEPGASISGDEAVLQRHTHVCVHACA